MCCDHDCPENKEMKSYETNNGKQQININKPNKTTKENESIHEITKKRIRSMANK